MKKPFIRSLIIGIVCVLLTNTYSHACRFTVREIGFSTLAQDIYVLVMADEGIDASDPSWHQLSNKLKDSNIELLFLHPKKDTIHPYFRELTRLKMSFPANVLFAPDGKMMALNRGDVPSLLELALHSPMRNEFIHSFVDVFAVVLWVEGKDPNANRQTEDRINRECERIESVMPHMPKEVRNGPVAHRITAEMFDDEKVLLWSLGVEVFPDDPMAFVLYGRGRIMGEALSASEVAEGKLYRYLSMIGADCECGLDRKWMLGSQIPMLWPSEVRQQLADEVGFDVDNPMILAEMSRILAKESDPGMAGEIGFGIEVIDLNEAFDDTPKINFDESEHKVLFNPFMLVILGFTSLVIVSGIYLFYRNQQK